MKKNSLYISRAYVEFGPFSKAELLDFQKRGILREIDHVRIHGEDDWFTLTQWLDSVAPAKSPSKKAAPKKKATAKKASPAPKTAVKKATKKAAKKTPKKAAAKKSPAKKKSKKD